MSRFDLSGRVRSSSVAPLWRALPVERGDRRWLALSALPGIVAVVVYLATNPYPAYGGGLYASIAAEIAANGYAPPARIPGYTADGVPFAYPPLGFYLFAVLLELGGTPLTVTRVVPGVVVVAALVPIYLLGRDVTASRPAGTAAAAFVALNPQMLQWHVTAGGIVRAVAFLFAITAIYAGYHAFGGRERAATADSEPASPPALAGRTPVALGAIAFGLTVLTHPTYALFVVATSLVLWGAYDRSVRGLATGLLVGAGGALIAAPWLGWVVDTHGLDVFTAAAGTHGGVGGGADALAGDLSAYLVVPLLAAGYLVARRVVFLPAWLVVAELLFAQPRFAYTAAAVVVPAAVVLAIRDGQLDVPAVTAPDRRATVAVLLVVAWTAGAGAYLAYETTLVTDPSTAEFVDDESIATMEWVAGETPPDATFVVVGDAAEWFPALTGRTILVGPWGVEWEGPDSYERQLSAYRTLSACHSAACVERTSQSVGDRPEYVYVPKGQYTVRGVTVTQFGTLERSFEHSPRWERAYENDGVVIYRAVDGE